MEVAEEKKRDSSKEGDLVMVVEGEGVKTFVHVTFR